MKKVFHAFSCLALFLTLNYCASGAGTSQGSTGSAALSLQLKELKAGESYRSADGFVLEFSHFALAFSNIQLGSLQNSSNFSADFFDEEVADVVEIANLPAGEYEDVALTLGLAEVGGGKALLIKQADSIPDALAGNSVYLQANADNGVESCVLEVMLKAEGQVIGVNPDGNHLEVEPNKEAELLLIVDPDILFADVDLASVCKDGAIVYILENSSLGQSLLQGLQQVLSMGSIEGHDHGHSH